MTWIRIEPAIVYRAAGEGRRYLTRGAAYKHAAKALIAEKRQCTCERSEPGGDDYETGYFEPISPPSWKLDPWERCPLHERPELVDRVARLMERDDERTGQ